MSRVNRKAIFVAAALLLSVFFHTNSHATYSTNKKWTSSYKVKSYHYSYQYRNSSKYSKRQWKSSSKYYFGKSHYRSSRWYKKKYYYSKTKCYKRKCKKYYYKKDIKPVAANDQYSIETNEIIIQNVITENDTNGDGTSTVKIVEGTLPDGIVLASDGSLSGSTTQIGTFTVRYSLKDNDGDTSEATITINVREADIEPVAVDDEYSLSAGEELNQNIVSENDTNGNGDNTTHIIEGSLPAGISLASDGTLSGTTDELGTFEIVYKLVDADGDYSNATLILNVTKDVAYCPFEAISDELHNGNHSHALWIPQISTNLTFLENPTAVRTLPFGDLVISGTATDADNEFIVTMTLSGYEATSDDPKLELKQSAYVENGGIIDPSTWEYFTSLTGTMVGTSGDFAGTTLTFDRRGPAAQIGVGANGKNQNLGISSWFYAQIDSTTGVLPEGFQIGQQLHGDINIDLPEECQVRREVVATQCSVDAPADSFAKYSDGHALVLVGLNQPKFKFEPAAEVRYYSNGDIEISGKAIDSNGQGFNTELVYTLATDIGTPKLELIDAAYIDMAGPVDPSTWQYFDGFSGTLTGLSGDYEGVEIALTGRGPSTQLGDGANGKNITFGLSNWLDGEIITGNSASGLNAGEIYRGDVNIDIKDDCNVIVDLPVVAEDDSYELEVGEALDANILDNDTLGDPDTTLTVNPLDIPVGFSVSDDGQITGATFEAGATFTFDYTITDADGDSDTATVTITTPEAQNLPVDAVDDTYTLEVGESLNANILDNDQLGDPDTTLSFNLFDIPFGIQLQSDGTLTGAPFIANPVIVFNYTITDANGDTDTATVRILTPDSSG